MSHPIVRRLLPLALLLAATAARAEPILDHVPPDALGFALARNVSAANDKIEKFLKIFEDLSDTPVPPPWPFVKAATGLGDGLNEQGDVLVALLSGPDGPAEPRPMLLVAVADYSKFAASISGDASGEICRVTIAGEEVLAARRGSYAMLMNVEHRPVMESILASEPTAPAALAPITDWMSSTDVSLVLTPLGVDLLTKLGQDELSKARQQLDERTDPALAEMMKQYRQGLQLYEMILGYLGAEVDVAAVGLSIDDATNVRLSKRFVLDKSGQAASWGDAPAPSPSPLAGFPAEPFVLGGGGPTPAAWGEGMASFARKMTEQFAKESGFEKFDEDQWKKVEQSWKSVMKGIRSTSFVMLPGEKEDPLISNVFYVVKVDDANQYIKSSRESYELWNKLLEESSLDLGMMMKYEFEDVEVAGKKGLAMTSDVSKVVDDAGLPMFSGVMNSIFGEDGKFRIHLIAADKTTVVTALASHDRLAEAIDHAVAGETGLAESAEVQAAATLLEPGAPWQFFVSPQGVVQWGSRLVALVTAQFGGGAENIPAYPESPPVGFSWTLAAGQFHAEMVWPVETLEQLAAYIKTCQGED
jgi:hypothetical protein